MLLNYSIPALHFGRSFFFSCVATGQQHLEKKSLEPAGNFGSPCQWSKRNLKPGVYLAKPMQ